MMGEIIKDRERKGEDERKKERKRDANIFKEITVGIEPGREIQRQTGTISPSQK